MLLVERHAGQEAFLATDVGFEVLAGARDVEKPAGLQGTGARFHGGIVRGRPGRGQEPLHAAGSEQNAQLPGPEQPFQWRGRRWGIYGMSIIL